VAPDQLLTVAEVAEILRVSEGWVYTNKGRIGFVRTGGVRFEPDAVRRYIESQRCAVPVADPVSTAERTPRTSGRSTRPRAAVTPSDNPQVAETMRRLARGLRPVNSRG
jgi:excisionase family DNA binding protein